MEQHPCFSPACNAFARIHLPVAPACNIQCRYCVRKYSCVNESRPGVTAAVMTPEAAAAWYKEMKAKVPRLVVAGIAGPGDALENWTQVRTVLEAVRRLDPSVKLCLSTNGLRLPEYAEELHELGVAYITVTVNARKEAVGAEIYEYVRDGRSVYRGKEAAALLLERQWEGIERIRRWGCTVKINSVAIKGINEGELEGIAAKAAQLGCEVMNIIPMIPVPGSAFQDWPVWQEKEIEALRKQAGTYIWQMTHCRRCRADAVGSLEE